MRVTSVWFSDMYGTWKARYDTAFGHLTRNLGDLDDESRRRVAGKARALADARCKDEFARWFGPRAWSWFARTRSELEENGEAGDELGWWGWNPTFEP